jgi:hypothetical protein
VVVVVFDVVLVDGLFGHRCRCRLGLVRAAVARRSMPGTPQDSPGAGHHDPGR